MRSYTLASAVATGLVATSLFASSVVADVDPIVIKGSKFFYKTNGTQFYIKGVAYQQDYAGNGTSTDGQTYTDPLSDSAACSRDIPYLQGLGLNAIRVYAINPSQNHDDCMNQLAAAGIYVLADLSAPVDGSSINRDTPAWNDALYTRYTSVVDVMAKYSNTLGFFGGNEVSNALNNTEASAFVKAAVRDTKAYISSKGYRPMGVGYATNDDADIRHNMADYFDCGDSSTTIDFWGYNIYEWCGDSDFQTSGYADRTKEFSTYNVPVFFAEYGCIHPKPRAFTEVQALYGPDMNGVWSGGIVYMYFEEDNNYGIVSVSGNSVSTLDDYNNLRTQLASVSPTGVQMGSYSPTNTAAACPTGSAWAAVSSPLPPTPNKDLCSCMYNTLSCVVAPSTDSKQYGDLFGTVCGYNNGAYCAGIAANASTGTYGAYSMCNSTEQLAYVFNNYYNGQKKDSSACDFKGAASLQSASAASGTCASLINEAGTAGTGTLTGSPTGVKSSSSKGAGAMTSVPRMETGLLPLVLVATTAVLSGFGMVLL